MYLSTRNAILYRELGQLKLASATGCIRSTPNSCRRSGVSKRPCASISFAHSRKSLLNSLPACSTAGPPYDPVGHLASPLSIAFGATPPYVKMRFSRFSPLVFGSPVCLCNNDPELSAAERHDNYDTSARAGGTARVARLPGAHVKHDHSACRYRAAHVPW